MAGLLNSSKGGSAGILSNIFSGLPKQEQLLKFIQSPEAMGLAQGLLEGSQPSMGQPNTFSSGLASGLGNMQKIDKESRDRLLEAARVEILKGQLDVSRGTLGLEREKAALAAKLKEQRQKQLLDLLSGNTDSVGGYAPTAEQKERAAILAAGGYDEEAYKVLTEADPSKAATTATITASQEQLRSLDSAIPALEKLKDIKQPDIPGVIGGQLYTSLTSPSETRIAEKKIKDVAKDYLSAH